MKKLTSKALCCSGTINIELGKRVCRESNSSNLCWLLQNSDVREVVLNTPLITKGAILQKSLTWTEQEKCAYILAYMRQQEVLRVVFYKDRNYDERDFEKSTMHIIDGKQRLNALIEFSINCTQFVEIDNQKYYWQDLDEDLKKSFYRNTVFYSGIVSEYNYCTELAKKPGYIYAQYTDPKNYAVSDDALIAWYLELNSLNLPTHREHIHKLKALLLK